MHGSRFRLWSFLLCAGLWATPLSAAPALSELIEKRLSPLTASGAPGVAVLIARDGKILYQGGYGLADLAAKTPVTPETKFRICSVTKQFTAAAILRLADERKLQISDPLEKYFPGFPRPGEITLHHLLTHTSGLHNYTEKPEFLSGVEKAIAPDALIASFRDDPLDFAPGAGFHYSNTGYFLLGEIVAKVSGRSFGEYLHEQFFEPLGMHATGILMNANAPSGLARGYSCADGKAPLALDWDMSWAGGAGALYSTIGDLLRWNEALFHGGLLRAESRRAMTTPVTLPAGVDGLAYGYGILKGEFHRLTMFGHSGGINGWSSELLSFPEQHCTVVVLANALPEQPGFATGALANGFAKSALAGEISLEPAPQEDPDVDPKTFSDYVGNYNYGGATLTVSHEDGHLFAQLTGQPKFEIFAEAADKFFWKVVDARVAFLRDEHGAVVAAQHTQNGRTFKAPRTK